MWPRTFGGGSSRSRTPRFPVPMLQAGHNSHQIAHEKALGAANVENAVPLARAGNARQCRAPRESASIIAIAAIALLSARPIEIFAPKSAGNNRFSPACPCFASGKIAFCARIFCEQIDLSHWLGLSCRRASLPNPQLATSNASQERRRRRLLNVEMRWVTGLCAERERSRPAALHAPRPSRRQRGTSRMRRLPD